MERKTNSSEKECYIIICTKCVILRKNYYKQKLEAEFIVSLDFGGFAGKNRELELRHSFARSFNIPD